MPTGRPSKRTRSELGARLLALREAAKLSQRAVADALGVRQQIVAYLEREAVALRPAHATKLARLFELSVGELLGDAPSNAHGVGPVLTVRQLCAEIGTLPRLHQEQIVKVVTVLVAQAKAS